MLTQFLKKIVIPLCVVALFTVKNSQAQQNASPSKARNAELPVIFENDKTSLNEKRAAYQAWLAKYPPASFAENDQIIYLLGAARMTQKLIDAKQYDEAITMVKGYSNAPMHLDIASVAASQLITAKQHTLAINMLYPLVQSAEHLEKATRTQQSIISHYAGAQIQEGKAGEGVPRMERLIAQHKYRLRGDETVTLAKGYSALGKDQQAFALLETYFLNKEPNVLVLHALAPLYNKINGKKGDWNAYKSKITGSIQSELKTKFRKQMISEKAPDFTLTDMAGKPVSLNDYKGKIVVLDFWATWCGPCIGSFPGMQVAVDKYKKDPGVEFLFVNTRQREENYKEVVTKFMANTKYNFHVAYDEMKDAAKATITAYKITGIPTKIFIDPQGMIRFRSVGGHIDIGTVVSEVDARIALIKEATTVK